MTDKEFLKDIYNPYNSDGDQINEIRYIFSEALHSSNTTEIMNKEKVLNEKIEIANGEQCFFEGDYTKTPTDVDVLTLQQRNTINELMTYCHMFTDAGAAPDTAISIEKEPSIFEFKKDFYKKVTPIKRNHPQNILRLFGSVYRELPDEYMLIGNKKVKAGPAVNQAENYLFSKGMVINFYKTPVFGKKNVWNTDTGSSFNFAVKFKHPKTNKHNSINIVIENSEPYENSTAKRQLRRLSAAVGAKWENDRLNKTFIVEDAINKKLKYKENVFKVDNHTYKPVKDYECESDCDEYISASCKPEHDINIDMSMNNQIFPGISDTNTVPLRVAKITDDNGVILSCGSVTDFIKIDNIPDDKYSERDDDDSFIFTGQIPTIGDLYRYATVGTQELSYKDTKLRFKIKSDPDKYTSIEMDKNGCFGNKSIDKDGFATGKFGRFDDMTINLQEIIENDSKQKETDEHNLNFLTINFDTSFINKNIVPVGEYIKKQEKELDEFKRKSEAKRKGHADGIVKPRIEDDNQSIKFVDEFGVGLPNARFKIKSEVEPVDFAPKGLLHLANDGRYNIRSIAQLKRIMRRIKKYDKQGNLVPEYGAYGISGEYFYDTVEKFMKAGGVQRVAWTDNIDKIYHKEYLNIFLKKMPLFIPAFQGYIDAKNYNTNQFLRSLGTNIADFTEDNNHYKMQLMEKLKTTAETAPAGTAPAGTAPAGTAPAGTAPAETAPAGWEKSGYAGGDDMYKLALKLIDEQLKIKGRPPIGNDYKTLPIDNPKIEKTYGILYAGQIYSLDYLQNYDGEEEDGVLPNKYQCTNSGGKKTYSVGGVSVTNEGDGSFNFHPKSEFGYVKFKTEETPNKDDKAKSGETTYKIIINERSPPSLTLILEMIMTEEERKGVKEMEKVVDEVNNMLKTGNTKTPEMTEETWKQQQLVKLSESPHATVKKLIKLTNLSQGYIIKKNGWITGWKKDKIQIGSSMGPKDTSTITTKILQKWMKNGDSTGKTILEDLGKKLEAPTQLPFLPDVTTDGGFVKIKDLHNEAIENLDTSLNEIEKEFNKAIYKEVMDGEELPETEEWARDPEQLGFEAAEVKGTNLFDKMKEGLEGMMRTENAAHAHENEFVPMNVWYKEKSEGFTGWTKNGFTRNITMKFNNDNLQCEKQEVSWDHDVTERSNSKIHYLFMLNQYIYVCLYHLSTNYIRTTTENLPDEYKRKSGKPSYEEISNIWRFFEEDGDGNFPIKLGEGEKSTFDVTYNELKKLFNFGFEFAEIYPKKPEGNNYDSIPLKNAKVDIPNNSTLVNFNINQAFPQETAIETFYNYHFKNIKNEIKKKLNDDSDVKYIAKLYTIYTRRYVCVYNKKEDMPSVYFAAWITGKMVDGDWPILSVVDWGKRGLELNVEQSKKIYLVYALDQENPFGRKIKDKLTAYRFTIEDARILTAENKHEFFLSQLLTKIGVASGDEVTLEIIKGGKCVPIENQNPILSGFITKLKKDITDNIGVTAAAVVEEEVDAKVRLVMMVVQLMFFTLLHGNNYMDYDVLSIEQFLRACKYFGKKAGLPGDDSKPTECIENYIKVGDPKYWRHMCDVEKDAIRNIVMGTQDETDVQKLLKDRKIYCAKLETAELGGEEKREHFMDEVFIPHISEDRMWGHLDESDDRKETVVGGQTDGAYKSMSRYYLYQDLINYMKYITIKKILPRNHRFDCFFDKFCYLCSQIVKDHKKDEDSIFFNKYMLENLKGENDGSGSGSGSDGSGSSSSSSGASGKVNPVKVGEDDEAKLDEVGEDDENDGGDDDDTTSTAAAAGASGATTAGSGMRSSSSSNSDSDSDSSSSSSGSD